MTDDYADLTKAQLQAELRGRGLTDSGDATDLRRRLRDDDDRAASRERSGPDDGRGEPDDAEDAEPVEADERNASAGDERASTRTADPVERAVQSLRSITGHSFDSVTGAVRDGEVVRVSVELLEEPGVPPTLDKLGSYEVVLDADGELISHRLVDRFIRGQRAR